eukprot:Skav225799  [mRNA]  locus=scaffold4213:15552:16004:+ [translate_table: standard]
MASEQIPPEQLVASSEGPEVLTCYKCGGPAEDGIAKGNGQVCKNCNNIYQLMYRHLGGIPASLQALDPKAQCAFFRKSSEALKAVPKGGRWALLRSSLITSVVHYNEQEEFRSKVSKEYLPLSVWKTRGFDTDAVVAHGEKKDCKVPRRV